MTIRDELSLLFQSYVSAYRRADAAGCAAVFATDGQLFSPYGSAKGQNEIADLHRDW
ncbi:hypothetical protein [uncultured Ruegeria sp.]|uniref:hypothetical protein n=1 Tax=uncultured Ruegeria sp. TaxID=259304 RepID=UPI00260F21D2|nr:hypothetical protein [uncultured Ruegeria sp.]